MIPKGEAYLNDWSICSCYVHGDRGQHLHGRLIGRHPKLGECPESVKNTPDEIITTSTIVAIDLHTGIAETLNTVYCLGERKQG